MTHYNQLLDVVMTDDRVEISIGQKHLLQFLRDSDQWPTHDSGRPLKVLDKDEFIEELCEMLMQESENGETLIHKVFTEAAVQVFESGSETIEAEKSLSSRDFNGDDDEEYDDDGDDGYRHDEWN